MTVKHTPLEQCQKELSAARNKLLNAAVDIPEIKALNAELLEALLECVAYIELGQDSPAAQLDVTRPARSAIAKATGETT